MSATGTSSRLGWYARRVARMSPAEVTWRVRDHLLKMAWSRRQVRPEQITEGAPPPPGERRFTAVLPPDTAARVPERPGRPFFAARTGCCAVSGKCWAWSGPIWCGQTGSTTP